MELGREREAGAGEFGEIDEDVQDPEFTVRVREQYQSESREYVSFTCIDHGEAERGKKTTYLDSFSLFAATLSEKRPRRERV
jgi:hypothetical protein